MSKTCAFPGCGIRLSVRNYSSVCRNHTHRVGFCTCTNCDGRVMPPLLPSLVLAPKPDPEPEPELLVPDPETATIEELCRPLSARIKTRHVYNWAVSTSFSARSEE